MYDAPFDPATRVGWVLAAVVAVLLVVRAVRTEVRATSPAPRTAAVRALDAGLDVLVALAVVALLATLAVVVVTAFAAAP